MSNDEQGYIVFGNLREAGKGENYGKIVQVKPPAEPFATSNACGTIAPMTSEEIRNEASAFADRINATL